jgi:hypothetical protein
MEPLSGFGNCQRTSSAKAFSEYTPRVRRSWVAFMLEMMPTVTLVVNDYNTRACL